MFGEEIRDVQATARLLIQRYPDAALKIAMALVEDNQDHGNETRAQVWAQVASEIRVASWPGAGR